MGIGIMEMFAEGMAMCFLLDFALRIRSRLDQSKAPTRYTGSTNWWVSSLPQRTRGVTICQIERREPWKQGVCATCVIICQCCCPAILSV
jgi:hypothetical protein